MADGFFLYSLLEIKQRYGISGVQIDTLLPVIYTYWIGHLVPDIDQSLSMYQDLIKTGFSSRWAKHKCSVPGISHYNLYVFSHQLENASKSIYFKVVKECSLSMGV